MTRQNKNIQLHQNSTPEEEEQGEAKEESRKQNKLLLTKMTTAIMTMTMKKKAATTRMQPSLQAVAVVGENSLTLNSPALLHCTKKARSEN